MNRERQRDNRGRKGMSITKSEAKTAGVLWQDYRFLTKEMLKFLKEQDYDLFYELLKQREKLQRRIENAPDNDDFKASPAGGSLFEEIREDSEAVKEALQVIVGGSRRQHKLSQAYSVASTMAVSLMSKKE